jgi:hypothetical protein
MTARYRVTLALLAVYAIAGCASTPAPDGARAADPSLRYTLVNLHPDDGRRRMYTMNYQQPGLIPRCTAVRFLETGTTHTIVEIAANSRRYLYMTHQSLPEPLARHLARYFGKSCDPAAVTTLSDVDRDGIARGKALPGMTKDGVLLAIGYPPEHVTPTREANVWTYWKSRSRTFTVEFDDGKVVRITD